MSVNDQHSERKAFKDYFDKDAARALAAQIRDVGGDFDDRKFVRLASRGLNDLEFNGRVRQFSSSLRQTLPQDVPDALAILTASLPPSLPGCDSVTDGWLQWPVGQFIADYGVPHFEPSMTAMIALTKRFSSEFAIRPFVDQQPEATFERLLALTTDENPHVRRWCSEGCRPRLPWGKKLTALVADPSPIFPILDALKDDPELYVRRSVANNLNDITKDHPSLVVERCKQWAKTAKPEREWVIKHAIRSLVKAGDPHALALSGVGPPKGLEVRFELSPKKIRTGQAVTMSLGLRSKASRAQQLVIDYVMHFVRKNGSHSEKVFKWKRLEIPAKSDIELSKKHAMKQTTVRALYPGVHRIEIQINGMRFADGEFTLA